MKRVFFFVFISIMISGCDDGEFVIERLEFDDTEIQKSCSNNNTTLFKISESETEALILKITDIVNFKEVDTLVFNIDNNKNQVLYRIFDAKVTNSYFCQTVPPTAPLVTEEWYAPNGTIRIVTTVEDDDKDGVPTAQEEVIYNEDGTVNKEASRDSDGDSIPDYIDRDDDNDNVFTEDEIDFDDLKQIIFIDTDEDGNPNYLDDDDDDDGVFTIDEDLNGDGNLANDTTDIEGVKVPNYLTKAAATATTDVFGIKKNEYQSIYSSEIMIVESFKLQNGNEEIKFDVDEYLYGIIKTPVPQTQK